MKNKILALSAFLFAATPYAQDKPLLQPSRSSIIINAKETTAIGEPLILVDSFETDMQSMILSPNNIASIDVYKDSTSLHKWGSRGRHGVVLIKLKPGTHLSTIHDLVRPASSADNVQRIIKAEVNGVVIKNVQRLLLDRDEMASITHSGDLLMDENCNPVMENIVHISTRSSVILKQ